VPSYRKTSSSLNDSHTSQSFKFDPYITSLSSTRKPTWHLSTYLSGLYGVLRKYYREVIQEHTRHLTFQVMQILRLPTSYEVTSLRQAYLAVPDQADSSLPTVEVLYGV
jgi:hypothetical protein